VLRDFKDARALRSDLATASSVLVIGGGFLGMEIASTCRALGKEVTVVDREPPLQRLLGPLVASRVRQAARDAGVRLRVSPGNVELIRGDTPDGPPGGARLTDGEVLVADVVISAVGDVPNVEWLHGSGLVVDGGVRVDAWCRALPGVVAVGDVAAMARRGEASCRIPSWTNAVEQARAAVRGLLKGTEAAPYRPSHYYWTEQFGLDIKVVGPPDAAGEPRISDGSLDHPPALLEWHEAGATRRVITVNHAIRPAQLKRLVPAREEALATHAP
jgi:NADPH-dependent 2,4-dienoyl-CoA reductase/sulfur reductase-like enzyme